MKILGFAASNSKNSINKKLVQFVLSKVNDESEMIDINDYEMPIYSFDYETEIGIPPEAQAFLDKIADFDLIIISHAEHNGNFSAYYKNLLDWCSRISVNVFQGKKLVLLATSPGMQGGKNVLETAKVTSHIFNGKICFTMPIPDFYNKFVNNDIVDQSLKHKLFSQLEQIGLQIK
jgi:NAD(P)H-dependent FMN reductase